MLLVVDDQPAIRQLLSEALESEGHAVVVASNGYEAINITRQQKPELILLDLKMPGLGGLETLREIHKYSPDIPVILITAYGELSDLGEAERLGVRRLIIKPFDLNEVRSLVRSVLSAVAV
ncbi:response regulator [Candidatus Desulforudis audaxviator]|uniref:Stage 0 sporulation protein A homolog n=1 Tax=Desulforudis audaxviator (strain MP104C) TaxID=477974 RepID=B1I6I2_DESAP|nr:response regulator [Candidatus Desulforudis audaxviator]ACA60664.1 response regulator receiver protein [Candidatus Desulforudis audaxviator MP104C]AZK60747.1 response regulator [Candidatus Desulforudis audaxviator]